MVWREAAVSERNHLGRVAILWLICSAIAELLLATVVPLPGPTLSREGVGEHNTIALLFFLGAPIFMFVVVFLAYEVAVFRQRPGDEDPPAEAANARGNPRALFFWSAISLVTVLFMAAWGTFTLNEVTEAAGPNPLTVQVIAQQWHFTYRYPSYGGVESFDLAIPVNRAIRFEITSLDVVHEFWIYDEDVKEDAVPGVTTYANLLAKTVGTHTIVCNELCGIWHGFMRGPVYVLAQKDFDHWIARQKTTLPLLKNKLPPYNGTYYPDPQSFPSAPQNSPE